MSILENTTIESLDLPGIKLRIINKIDNKLLRKWKNDNRECFFFHEIINPDQAISTFFINVRKKPFITTTELTPNGSCRKLVDLRVSNDNILIYIRDNLFHNGPINLLSEDKFKILNNLLYRYFGNDIRYFLNVPIKKKYTFKL